MKKLISILSAMVVLLSMTACGKNDDTSKSTTTTTTTAQTTTTPKEQPEIEPLPVPEGGWTSEELGKAVSINEQLVGYPFTLSFFGKEYSFDVESQLITYKNKEILYLSFDDSNDSQVIDGFATLELYDDSNFFNSLKINGVGIGSTVEEVETVLGLPNRIDGNNYIYNDIITQEELAVLWFDDDKKLQKLFIYYTLK